MITLSRRTVLRGAGGLAGAAAFASLAACSGGSPGRRPVGYADPAVLEREELRRRGGRRVVTARLQARPATVDLGGRSVDTWVYGEGVPGPVLRADAGDLMRIRVDNALPVETSVHWHGLALRNDMDGVPGLTQEPIAAGAGFVYSFTAPDPGTYFYHPHTGVQLDRGLYGVLVVDDPREPGGYDAEWLVVLDDWVDGTGRTPDQVLQSLREGSDPSRRPGRSGSSAAEPPMDHDAMMGGDQNGMNGMAGMNGLNGMAGMGSSVLGGGDVDHPHYLVNGRTPEAPVTLSGRPGQRVRMRIVNAGADTAFRVVLGGHRMTVTHSDGFPVVPQATDALLIGMGERYDVAVDLADGVFPLVAVAEGKGGRALALVRTAAGTAPARDVRPAELARPALLGAGLVAADEARLPEGTVDRRHTLVLGGSMRPYRWTINSEVFPDTPALPVVQGERVRLRLENRSMMFHPMHVHGHTFGLARGGARKDTVIVGPMRALEVDLDADNPGQWATHCHNIYHAEAGMMTILGYQA